MTARATYALLMRMVGAKQGWWGQEPIERQIFRLAQGGMQRPTPSIRRGFKVSRTRAANLGVVTLTPRWGSATRDLVYLHGGAFVFPLVTQHWWLIGALARDLSARVHVIDYLLAPQSTAAETVPTTVAAFRALGLERPLLAGDSAGGGLALVVARELRDAGAPPPGHLLLISPWLDLTASHPEFDEYARRDPILGRAGVASAALAYAGDLQPEDPLVSPFFGSDQGLCPITVVLSTRDALYPEGRDWAARARQSGVDIATLTLHGGVHVHPAATALPEARAVRRFIIARVTGAPPGRHEIRASRFVDWLLAAITAGNRN